MDCENKPQKSRRGRPRKNIEGSNKIDLSSITSSDSKLYDYNSELIVKFEDNNNISQYDVVKNNYIIYLSITKDDIIYENNSHKPSASSSVNTYNKTQYSNYSEDIYDVNASKLCGKININGANETNETNSSNASKLYGTNQSYNKILETVYVGEPIKLSKLEDTNKYYSGKYICISESNIPITLLTELASDNYEKMELLKLNIPSELFINSLGPQKQWPESSTYACWNCDMTFSGPPIGIPDKELNGKFYCYGNFCWFPCAYRYMLDRDIIEDVWNKKILLHALYNKVINNTCIELIIPAPPRETMKKYGGFLSENDYINCINKNKNFELYKMPIIPISVFINNLTESLNNNKNVKTYTSQPKNLYIPVNNELLAIAKKHVEALLKSSKN